MLYWYKKVQILTLTSNAGAAHAVLEEAPEACAQAVAAFLRDVVSAGGAAAQPPPPDCAPLMIASAAGAQFTCFTGTKYLLYWYKNTNNDS